MSIGAYAVIADRKKYMAIIIEGDATAEVSPAKATGSREERFVEPQGLDDLLGDDDLSDMVEEEE